MEKVFIPAVLLYRLWIEGYGKGTESLPAIVPPWIEMDPRFPSLRAWVPKCAGEPGQESYFEKENGL